MVGLKKITTATITNNKTNEKNLRKIGKLSKLVITKEILFKVKLMKHRQKYS